MSDYPDNYLDLLKYSLVVKYNECEHDFGNTILLSLPGKVQCKKCYMIEESPNE